MRPARPAERIVPRTSMVVPAPNEESHRTQTAAGALVEVLVALGVEHAFGLVGGAIAPFCDALLGSSIQVMHARHEGGAGFAAVESSLASGRPALVFTTTGPGLTNAITGMVAARWEGAKVILVSGVTSSHQRGRGAFQETSPYTMGGTGLFHPGAIFDYAVTVESAAELHEVASRLASGLARPGAFVAHVALPIAIQSIPAESPVRARVASMRPGCDDAGVAQIAEMLAHEPFVVWLGFGARDASHAVRQLVERSGAKVMCSPRAKGIFPEDHPQFLGVTGLGGHASVGSYMVAHRPRHVLVLGSRLGEFTSFWAPELTPRESFVHVDIDATSFGAAYPEVETVGVQAEIRPFVMALANQFDAPSSRTVGTRPLDVAPIPRRDFGVRPTAAMAAIQRVIVDATDAIVLTEAGNAFLLGSHLLRFSEAGRYRTSTGFGSMGHAVAGVIGAALGGRRKAVAIVGDGAMLMQSEVSTAVQYGIKAVWIVLNDARYGMVDSGMRANGLRPVETEIPSADFIAIARGMGADGIRVTCETDLDLALESAMVADRPFVVDVVLDRTAPLPSYGRIQSLQKQGVTGNEERGK